MDVSKQLSTDPHVGQIDVISNDVAQMTFERADVVTGESTTEDRKLWTSQHSIGPNSIPERAAQIAQTIVQTSDTALTPLFSVYPTEAFLGTDAFSGIAVHFGIVRGTLEVIVVTTCPANAYGMYLVQALPEGGRLGPFPSAGGGGGGTFYEMDNSTYDTVYTATQGIHALIDISKSNTVVMRLPFVYPVDAYSLTTQIADRGDAWRIVVWCLSSIKNSVNSNSVSGTVKVYARFTEDYELGVPVVQSAKPKTGGKKKSVMEKVGDLRESKFLSKTSKTVASIATLATTIPMLAPLAGPIAAGAASFSSMADYFGFTKEAKPIEPAPFKSSNWTNPCAVDGFDSSDVVALFQNNTTTIDATVGGGDAADELAVGSLYARWLIVDIF